MSALRGPQRTSKGRMVMAAAGYASLMLMAAATTKRSVAAAEGGYEKRGKAARSLLPLLCVWNINDNHFSPDSGANPRRALRKTTRVGDCSPFHRAICPA